MSTLLYVWNVRALRRRCEDRQSLKYHKLVPDIPYLFIHVRTPSFPNNVMKILSLFSGSELGDPRVIVVIGADVVGVKHPGLVGVHHVTTVTLESQEFRLGWAEFCIWRKMFF